MRVEMATEQNGRLIHHRLGNVAVQVERSDHGNTRADDIANRRQDRPFQVIGAFGDARAVEREADRIDRSGLLGRRDAGDEIAQEMVVRRPGDGAPGLGPGCQSRDDLVAALFSSGDHAAEVTTYALVPIDHLLARKPTTRPEMLLGRLSGAEGVGLVGNLADDYPHSLGPFIRKRSPLIAILTEVERS
jgi:hypothetical protein